MIDIIRATCGILMQFHLWNPHYDNEVVVGVAAQMTADRSLASFAFRYAKLVAVAVAEYRAWPF